MKRKERSEIKSFIYNVLLIFQHQEEFLADESGVPNYENEMLNKAMNYILGVKK